MLPTKIKEPSDDIRDYIMFLAGEKGVGKTSFICAHPKHYLMEFEIGNAKHVRGNWEDIPSLKVFEIRLSELEKQKEGDRNKYCDVIAIDGIQILYEMICQNIQDIEDVWDLGQIPHGRGWGAADRKFKGYLTRIQSLGAGVIYTGHTAVSKDIQTREGNTINKLEAGLGASPARNMDRIVHCWFVMLFSKDGGRELIISGDTTLKACNKLLNIGEGHFKLIKDRKVPLGNSPQEGYTNFQKAWNNIPIDGKNSAPSIKAKLGRSKIAGSSIQRKN
jgi:hypothetical protein